MFKAALEYLVGLKPTNIFTIEGETYSDRELKRIPKVKRLPSRYEVKSLDAISKLIRTEIGNSLVPLFIRIDSPTRVYVESTWDSDFDRCCQYSAICEEANFRPGWRDQENAIGILDNVQSQTGATIKMYQVIPQMDFVIECKNRLWGCFYGKNDAGETINEIYCCVLGDFKNWYRFMGVSTDSYVASVGTEGPWTGAVNYLGYLHEVLSDIRLALAVGIFTTGWAFGIIWSSVFYLIGSKEVRKMAKKKGGCKGGKCGK